MNSAGGYAKATTWVDRWSSLRERQAGWREPDEAAGVRRGTRRVGVIIVNAENDPEGQARIDGFRRGLQELHWTEGRNLVIDYHWGVSEPVR
jgi:hypothetical protein